MEQVRSSEQQAKTRQIYHHQEEMRAVRIDHERERAELLEVRTLAEQNTMTRDTHRSPIILVSCSNVKRTRLL